MDLKFTFNNGPKKQPADDGHGHGDGHSHDGDSHDGHGHGGPAGPGIPLPLAPKPVSMSSVLELRARRDGDGVLAEAVSGDGVVYAGERATLANGEQADAPALAKALRSALSRVVAALEGPLSESVTTITVAVDGPDVSGADALRELGIAVDTGSDQAATVDAALQRRVGVAAGIPITLA